MELTHGAQILELTHEAQILELTHEAQILRAAAVYTLFIVWIIEGSYISHWRSRISRKNILCLKKKVGEQRLVLTLQVKHEICHSLPRAWSPWWVGDMDLPQAKHFFLLISHEQSLHKGLFLCIYNFSFKGWLQRVQ